MQIHNDVGLEDSVIFVNIVLLFMLIGDFVILRKSERK